MEQTIKFINKDRSQFFAVLRKRVNAHFKEKGIQKTANGAMIFKTCVMLGMFFIPYFLMLSMPMSAWALLGFAFIMGLGKAGIGMSVMHDANHGAYSKNKWVNFFLGYTLNLMGGNVFNWKVQHNMLHHTYTNIHEHDEDLEAGLIVRFSPHQEHRWFHKFQHFYAFALYSLVTLMWVLIKDWKKVIRYNKNGLTKEANANPQKELMILLFSKIFYIAYTVVIPFIILGIPVWQFLIGYIVMHVVAGVMLTTVFQLAHIVEDLDQPLPDAEGNIENSWAIHQMYTTANFSKGNPLITFYVGGLNYQIEHHLFPNICHIHYPEISEIVKATAAEYNVPYYGDFTLGGALMSHMTILKKMGEETEEDRRRKKEAA